MKKADFILLAAVALFFLPFFTCQFVFDSYINFNAEHGMIMSFIKFGLLATLGEVIGLRIRTGSYYQKGFGLIPRAIVWGFLGLTIKMAFVIFAVGTPAFLAYLGMKDAPILMKEAFSFDKLLVAFSISAAMNLIYAPVMMTLHKITDMHIIQNGGSIAGLFKPIKFKEHFVNLDWTVQWGFVFKKTIPFFWIPAHTITFMLPPDFQVLFAALLGIALGMILAVAGMKKK
ncbi:MULTISPECIES: hypothetical protein [unclassified Lentimicrobium]|uniref:hypothetical protein n=1 Tax=unclassified Lentimicrobium TaxID=2677434 RepID=UPI00155744E0|nr:MULTISPECIES: hypothetical protein [unclassified Lentimicrobium]NPD46832.1 hypothetical protein [Lentimicrobium sp. S6]NPD85120.1 hypothetical protein [Lentimicrobium sp. L6]